MLHHHRFDQQFQIGKADLGMAKRRGMTDWHAKAALGVQRRPSIAPPDLQKMRNVPFLRLTIDAGDGPAMAASAFTDLGEEIPHNIACLDSRGAQRGEEIGMNIDARPFGQPAGQMGHMIETIGEFL